MTFGDSNTDLGFIGTNASAESRLVRLERQSGDRLGANAPNDATAARRQDRGTLEGEPYEDDQGGKSRRSPELRRGTGRTYPPRAERAGAVGGVTRFRGEVLGDAYPWSGGEPVNSRPVSERANPARSGVQAARDRLRIHLDGNERHRGRGHFSTHCRREIAINLEIMVDEWIWRGLAPNRLIITTLPPRRPGTESATIPDLNNRISARSLSEKGFA